METGLPLEEFDTPEGRAQGDGLQMLEHHTKKTLWLSGRFLLLSFYHVLAIALIALTSWIAEITRYHGLEYHAPAFFSSNPAFAILIIQICTTCALVMVKECFITTTEELRWWLASRGTPLLTFLALSGTTGLGGLLRLIIAQPLTPFVSWRGWAFFRIAVLYGALVVAQFISLLGIDSQIAYVPFGLQKGQTRHLGVGDFNLSMQGEPWPLPQIPSWDYLADTTRVVELIPTLCSPNSDGSCHSYLILPSPINYTYACLATNSSDCYPISCPYDDQNCNINGIFYDVPAYIVEFSNQKINESSYTHSMQHTSLLGVEVLMCLTADNPISPSVDFQFDICQEQYEGRTCQLPSSSATNATMYIDKANVTMVVNILNQTILDVSPTSRTPYAVNVSALFEAYIAPLTYSLVNFSVLRDADMPPHTLPQPGEEIHTNGGNSSSVADVWVDSTFYGLVLFLKAQPYHQRVYGFLAHALAVNSRKFFADDIERNWTLAKQETVFSVNQASVDVFTTLSLVIILMSVFMFWLARKHDPYLSLYPDITFASRSAEEMGMEFKELTIASSQEVIRKLADTGMIKVMAPVGQNALIISSDSTQNV
jgi:hypothetical protein